MKKQKTKLKFQKRKRGIGVITVITFCIFIAICSFYGGNFLQNYFNIMSEDIIGIQGQGVPQNNVSPIEKNRPRDLNVGNINLNE